MLPIKAALAAAFLAGIAEWIGRVPTAIIDAAAVCAALAYLVARVLVPVGRLVRRVFTSYEALEHLAATLAEFSERLGALEKGQDAIREPVEAVKRELGVTARGDAPHPDA